MVREPGAAASLDVLPHPARILPRPSRDTLLPNGWSFIDQALAGRAARRRVH